MPTAKQWQAAKARSVMNAALRDFFAARGFLEVEVPALVGTPGQEPHIDPFTVPFVPQTGVGTRRDLFLHTSPEYAMKRLLADGSPALFFLGHVFRNGEVSEHHNPEFTLLEFYRPHADYHAIMSDLEGALGCVERAITGTPSLFSRMPYERLTVRDAVLRETGIDLLLADDGAKLKAAAAEAGIRTGDATSFDDVFFHVFLQKVEPKLGLGRPTFLFEYPASMASLARLAPQNPRVAERVELYANGAELANGFSELTDAAEQRRRLEDEQQLRRSQNRPAFPLDEKFLEAVARMPPSSGIAVGMDRVLMQVLGASEISDVLLFPAKDFV